MSKRWVKANITITLKNPTRQPNPWTKQPVLFLYQEESHEEWSWHIQPTPVWSGAPYTMHTMWVERSQTCLTQPQPCRCLQALPQVLLDETVSESQEWTRAGGLHCKSQCLPSRKYTPSSKQILLLPWATALYKGHTQSVWEGFTFYSSTGRGWGILHYLLAWG